MDNFNENNVAVFQQLFKNYLINQSVFGAISGNYDFLNQAKNLMFYPLTFESYCYNVYSNALNNTKGGLKTFNSELNRESGDILLELCGNNSQERKVFEQIKETSFIYTNAMTCFNSNHSNTDSFLFDSSTYNKFVDDLSAYGPVYERDEGIKMNNDLFGGKVCEETLNLIKQPMYEAEKYLINHERNLVNNNIFCEEISQ